MKYVDTGDFFKALGGIASLQIGLPAMWTKMRSQKHSVALLTRWMCAEPARLAGLEAHKGSIAEGYDADIVVWNPERSFTVRPGILHHRHKLTPYLNSKLYGVVENTFLRGEMIYDHGRFPGKPKGALLRRGER